jgi:hypothetical protein
MCNNDSHGSTVNIKHSLDGWGQLAMWTRKEVMSGINDRIFGQKDCAPSVLVGARA